MQVLPLGPAARFREADVGAAGLISADARSVARWLGDDERWPDYSNPMAGLQTNRTRWPPGSIVARKLGVMVRPLSL